MFERKHGSPQRACVRSAGARCREGMQVTPPAAHLLGLYLCQTLAGKFAALPTERLIIMKKACLAPAVSAGNSICPRLDALAADCTCLRIENCKRGIVKLTEGTCEEHLRRTNGSADYADYMNLHKFMLMTGYCTNLMRQHYLFTGREGIQFNFIQGEVRCLKKSAKSLARIR